MAFATVHHWQDPIAGLREMQRVARRVVVFTCDNTDWSWRRRFWLTRDYPSEVAASRVGLATELARAIGARMEPVLIPWDCADGFFEAYWRRPEAYLDENVRRATSSMSRRQSLAFACLSPEPAGHAPARQFLPSSPSGQSGDRVAARLCGENVGEVGVERARIRLTRPSPPRMRRETPWLEDGSARSGSVQGETTGATGVEDAGRPLTRDEVYGSARIAQRS